MNMAQAEVSIARRAGLPEHSFLREVFITPIHDRQAERIGESPYSALIQRCLETQTPVIEQDGNSLPQETAAALCLPILREHTIVGVVTFAATRELPAQVDVPEPVGVLETWLPVGPFDELALASGYYGKMQRFANVSSFVRFERGNGLPGQVWEKCQGVIHDQLSKHPGFLRAAGASADLLQTALGIPVVAEKYIASVLLISSARTPICRGFEVWTVHETHAELVGGSYVDFDDTMTLNPGATCDSDQGWAELIEQAGGAVISQDVSILRYGRPESNGGDAPDAGLAIPCFDGSDLDSFVVLLF